MSSLAAFLFLSNTILYFILEAYTAAANTPSYSYTRQFTSALAYPHPYRDRDTDLLTHSHRAYVMKANFILNGLLTLVGQFAYIDERLIVARKALAVVYCLGIWLVAIDHGNTGRKQFEKSFGWHGLGAFLAIVSGNIASILAGLAAGMDGVYGWVSVGLGVGALLGMRMWAKKKDSQQRGLWQRSAIYPIQAWMGMTGVVLIVKDWY